MRVSKVRDGGNRGVLEGMLDALQADYPNSSFSLGLAYKIGHGGFVGTFVRP